MNWKFFIFYSKVLSFSWQLTGAVNYHSAPATVIEKVSNKIMKVSYGKVFQSSNQDSLDTNTLCTHFTKTLKHALTCEKIPRKKKHSRT